MTMTDSTRIAASAVVTGYCTRDHHHSLKRRSSGLIALYKNEMSLLDRLTAAAALVLKIPVGFELDCRGTPYRVVNPHAYDDLLNIRKNCPRRQ